jgi:hypothetical protein
VLPRRDVSSEGDITRPPAKAFDTSNVIKADQFPTWHQKFVDREFGVAKFLQVAANLRSLDTIKERAEKLLRQHRPANLLDLPAFMQPKSPLLKAPAARVPQATPAKDDALEATDKKRLLCLHCNQKISFPEGKFCWNNSARFRGGQYCRQHQALF